MKLRMKLYIDISLPFLELFLPGGVGKGTSSNYFSF